MQFIKFGFGRAIRDASRHIQNNIFTREEGLDLAKNMMVNFLKKILI